VFIRSARRRPTSATEHAEADSATGAPTDAHPAIVGGHNAHLVASAQLVTARMAEE
jgi:hypothetical protein